MPLKLFPTSRHGWLLTAVVFVLFVQFSIAEEPPKPGEKERSPQREVSLFDGKKLDGWRIVDKVDFEKHGKVRVKDGELLLEHGSPATGISYTGKPPRSNYEIALEAKRTDGSDFFCGLTFPVGDAYCTLICGGWGGDVTGLSNINNMSAEENATTGYTDFKNDKWYKIRLRVTDKSIAAWIDKEQILEVERGEKKFDIWWEQEPVRPLGIATWRTSAALRNIRLTRLDVPEQPKRTNAEPK